MKRTLLTLALLAASSAVHAAPWIYKGTLNDAGKPANGQYDLRITLLNEAKTAHVSSPITLSSVDVVDGIFSVEVDFGIDLTTAPVMALKTEVQQGESGFVSLGEATRFDAKAALGSSCWDTAGNAGTNGLSDFLGTTDNQPVSIRANNRRAILIQPSAELSLDRPITHNIVAGSRANLVVSPARGATIAGGGSENNADPTYTTGGSNRVDDHYGTVGGGFDNQAGSSSASATDAVFATVGGGLLNSANGSGSTVSGGDGNTASGIDSTVSGGDGNTASGVESAVSGGAGNIASGGNSSVSGGADNIASGSTSTVSAGAGNCAGGDNSWVGGRFAKTRVGNGVGDGTCAPSSADSDGDEGSFVWADRSVITDFVSTGPNQFLVRADGGFLVNTNSLGAPFPNDDMVIQARVSGDDDANLRLRAIGGLFTNFSVDSVTGTLQISGLIGAGQPRLTVAGGPGGPASLSNGGTWTNASSRSYKENFTAVNGLDVLSRLVALPIMTWDYIGSSEGLHMGPVAEDFKASFGLAGDGKSISTVDADGIALAAIQGLNAKLESENAALRARLDAVEARLK